MKVECFCRLNGEMRVKVISPRRSTEIVSSYRSI